MEAPEHTASLGQLLPAQALLAGHLPQCPTWATRHGNPAHYCGAPMPASEQRSSQCIDEEDKFPSMN